MDRELESNGHTVECQKTVQGKPCADTASEYNDIFREGCHDWFTDPHVLPNGTDIAWPSGCSEDQAKPWRAERGLSRPDNKSINELSAPSSGILPKDGGDQNDMAPTG